MSVRQNLHLNMARVGEIALHVTLVPPEIRQSFALRSSKLFGGFFGVFYDLHASPTPAVGPP